MSNVAAVNRVNARPSNNNMIIGVVVMILVLVGLYYLYNFLYGSSPSQASVNILSSPTSATKTTTVNGVDSVATTALTGIADGGAYTASLWVYINNTVGFNTQASPLIHLFDISNKGVSGVPASQGVAAVDAVPAGDTMLFVGLNPRTGSLIVRQSTADPAVVIDNSMASTDAGITNTKYPLTALINNYNAGGNTYTKDDRCDIVNGIEYQRWVLITVVANGRTLDVYIDGKLARSCVYKANYALNSATGKATAYVGSGNGGNLKGFFSNINYANYAYTPDAVWAQYQAGPGQPFSLASFFSNLFSVNVSFGTSSTSS